MSKINLYIFTLGNFVSQLGSSMQRTALPLFILDLTGKGSMMSLLTLCHMIPMLLATPVAGVIGDRLNRKRIMVATDIIRGILLIPLVFFGLQQAISLPLLFFIMSLSAILDAIFTSATSAMLPELVESDKLRQANSLYSGCTNLATLLGPVFGAILYSVFGIGMIFLFNFLSYLISGLFEIFIKYEHHANLEKATLTFFYTSAKDGLDFILKNNNLRNLVIFVLFINFLLSPIYSTILPYAVKEELGLSSLIYGFFGSSITAGIIIGALVVSTVLKKKSSTQLIKTGIITVCILTIFFSLLISPLASDLFKGPATIGIILIIALLITQGLAASICNIPLQTDLQTLIPNNYRSRVLSSTDLFAQMAMPLSVAITGIVLDYVPSFLISSVLGLALLGVGLLFLRNSQVSIAVKTEN